MTIKDAVNIELDKVIDDTKGRIVATGKNVTGKTADSMRKDVVDQGAKVIGTVYVSKFFKVLETGRKPTPDKKPGREMLSNIRDWADAKGLPEGIEWAIATNINKEGTKLWQQGGREDIFTPSIDEQAGESMTDRIGKVAVKIFAQELVKTSVKALIIFGLLSCSDPVVDTRLNWYVNQFYKEAQVRNVPVNRVSVSLEQINYNGLATSKEVKIDIDLFQKYNGKSKADSLMLLATIYHELGHAVLNRRHSDNYSLMNINGMYSWDFAKDPKPLTEELFYGSISR